MLMRMMMIDQLYIGMSKPLRTQPSVYCTAFLASLNRHVCRKCNRCRIVVFGYRLHTRIMFSKH